MTYFAGRLPAPVATAEPVGQPCGNLRPSFLHDGGPAGAMNGAVDAASARQAAVGRVDDGIDVLGVMSPVTSSSTPLPNWACMALAQFLWSSQSVLVEVGIVGERRSSSSPSTSSSSLLAAEGVGELVVLGEVVFPVLFEVVVELVVEVVVLEVVERILAAGRFGGRPEAELVGPVDGAASFDGFDVAGRASRWRGSQ